MAKIKFTNTETIEDTIVATVDDKAFVSGAPVDEKTLKKVYEWEDKYVEQVTEEGVNIALKNFQEGNIQKVSVNAPYRLDDELNVNIYKEHKDEESKPKIIATKNKDAKSVSEKFKELESKIAESLESVTV